MKQLIRINSIPIAAILILLTKNKAEIDWQILIINKITSSLKCKTMNNVILILPQNIKIWENII